MRAALAFAYVAGSAVLATAGKPANRPRASGTVSFDAPDVLEGPIERAQVQRTIASRHGVFMACYQKELDHDPRVGGRLVVRFEIDRKGAVNHPTVTTHINDILDRCVVYQLGRLVFPTGPAGSTVEVRAVFKPD